MNEKSLVPSIRFAGFTDAWERRKLGEVCSSLEYGMNAAAKEYDGENKYIRITDIDDNTRLFLASDLTSPDADLNDALRYRLETGDIVFARTGASVGKSYIYKNSDGTVYYAGFLIRAKVKQEHFADFVFQNTLSHNYEKYILITSQRSGQPGVNAQEYAGYTFYIPEYEEQKRVGTFLTKLDTLITLHQRKIEKLHNIKQAMLDKMFPKNGELFPEVRFAGYTGAWERRKLGETFTFLQNNTLSRADLSDSGDGAMNIHYGDILVKFGECTSIAKESLTVIMDDSVINKYRSSFLKNGDIVIADTAEDETVGKCTEIIEEKGETIISGLHTIPCRPICAFARGFLGYYMNSPAFHGQLIPLMQGIKVTSISKGALQTTMVQYPHEKIEQAQIGRIFQQLDRLITLHQRKLEKLQDIKKACLEKMFV